METVLNEAHDNIMTGNSTIDEGIADMNGKKFLQFWRSNSGFVLIKLFEKNPYEAGDKQNRLPHINHRQEKKGG